MFYAIRSGKNKGVYTSKELYQKKLKEDSKASFRVFKNPTERQAALKWAGVAEIADAMQEVVKEKKEKTNNTTDSVVKELTKEVKQLTAKMQQIIEQTSSIKNKKSDLEKLLEHYKRLGYGGVTLRIPQPEERFGYWEVGITFKDHYYSKKGYMGQWKSYIDNFKYKNDEDTGYYSSRRNYEDSLQTLQREKNILQILKANKYQFFGDLIYLESCGVPKLNQNGSNDEYYSFVYPNEHLTINSNSVESIEPFGHWKLDNRYLNLTSAMVKDFK